MRRRSRSLSPLLELVEPEGEPPLLELFALLPELKVPGLAELLKELPVGDGVPEPPPKRAV